MSVRLTPLALLALVGGLLGVPGVAHAAPAGLDGTFAIHFGGPHSTFTPGPGCDPDSFCGSGSLVGYGAANIYLNGDSYGPDLPGGCNAYDKTEDIVLPDGVSAMTLESSGTVCDPGSSGPVPASDSDYGRPGTYTTTYTVVEAYGRLSGFLGATGAETFKVSGSTGRWYVH